MAFGLLEGKMFMKKFSVRLQADDLERIKLQISENSVRVEQMSEAELTAAELSLSDRIHGLCETSGKAYEPQKKNISLEQRFRARFMGARGWGLCAAVFLALALWPRHDAIEPVAIQAKGSEPIQELSCDANLVSADRSTLEFDEIEQGILQALYPRLRCSQAVYAHTLVQASSGSWIVLGWNQKIDSQFHFVEHEGKLADLQGFKGLPFVQWVTREPLPQDFKDDVSQALWSMRINLP